MVKVKRGILKKKGALKNRNMKKYWCKKCQRYHYVHTDIGIKHKKYSSHIEKENKKYRW